MITCALCKKEIIGTQYKSKNKKRYHNECFEELVNKAEKTNQRKVKSIKKNERESLMQYICLLYRLQEVSYVIDKQIEDFVNNLGYTYVGIQEALCFFYEMEGNSIGNYNNTIGIVPYCYNEAKVFFETAREANEANKSFVNNEKTIKIKIKPQSRGVPCLTKIEDL